MKIELENCQKSLTLKDFEEIESKLGYALPERLKEFYLQYNGSSTKQTASINKYQEVEIEDFFPFKYNKDFKNDPRYTAEGETLELRKAGAISDSILIFAMESTDEGRITIDLVNGKIYLRALPGPRGQAEAGGLPAGHGADGLHAGADCHRGGSALYRHSGRAERRGVHSAGGAYPPGGQSGALPALRSGVALPHVEQKEDKTVMSAIFGPAGNAESFPYKSSADAPRWLAELGLDCYEYQCGKGVNVREETARNIGAAAVAAGIRLSLHAPYFINLANPDPAV